MRKADAPKAKARHTFARFGSTMTGQPQAPLWFVVNCAADRVSSTG
jgi:hypothetical protein